MENSQDRFRRAALQQLQSLQQAGLQQLPRPSIEFELFAAGEPQAEQPASSQAESIAAQAESRSATTAKGRPIATEQHSSQTDQSSLFPTEAKSTMPRSNSRNSDSNLSLLAEGRLEIPVGDTLEVIQQEVAACRACHELATTRTQTVFGVGNPNARLCFLGEAPGADEDKQGEPFVGRAGQLLTKIIEACTLSREEVYILNVLKCRPPGNRNPKPDEVAHCRGFLNRQLAQIQPEFICCLGSIATRTLLETEQTIGKMRGKFHSYQGIPVLCTYHPAYLLRNPSAKRQVWDDMKILMKEMGIKIE